MSADADLSHSPVKVWFMFDNHTFARVKMTTRDDVIEQVLNLFTEDGCGSLFVRDIQDGAFEHLCVHGRQIRPGHWGVTFNQIVVWMDALMQEIKFYHAMVA